MEIQAETWYDLGDYGEGYVRSISESYAEYDTRSDDNEPHSATVHLTKEVDGYGPMPSPWSIPVEEFAEIATRIDPQPQGEYRDEAATDDEPSDF